MVKDLIKELIEKEILKREDYEGLVKEICNLSKLWSSFSDDEQNFKKNNQDSRFKINTYEDFLGITNAFFNTLELNSENFNELKSIKKLNDELKSYKNKKIASISKKFIEVESENFFEKIASIGKIYSEKIKEMRKVDILFATTNYDGIFEHLLRTTKNQWLTKDEFRHGKYEHEKLKEKNILLHLHSSYKYEFEKKTKSLRKVRKDKKIKNRENGILVYDDPKNKLEAIKSYPELYNSFQYFEACIKETDKIFIVGNSLKSDPHICEIIKDKIKDEKTKIYIIDIDIEGIQNILTEGSEELKDKKIMENPKEKFKSLEDFYNYLLAKINNTDNNKGDTYNV